MITVDVETQEVFKKFVKRRTKFCNFLEVAKSIALQLESKDLNICSENPDLVGIDLFVRLISTSESIVKILPKEGKDFENKFLDYYSIFSLTRNIIETSEILFYIFMDTYNNDERFFRIKQLQVSDTNLWISKIKYILKEANNQTWKDELCKQSKRKYELLEEIKYNPIYKKLRPEANVKFKSVSKKFFKIARNKSEDIDLLELEDSNMYILESDMKYLNKDTSIFAYFICSAISHSQSSTVNSFLFNSKEGLKYALDNISTALYFSSVYFAHSSKIFIKKVIPVINTIYEQYTKAERMQLQKAFKHIDDLLKIINT